MSEISFQVKEIKGKIDALFNKCSALESQLAALEIEKANIIAESEKKQNLFKELEQKYKVLKMAKSLEGTQESKTDVKLKINELVREIDKCIALLNR